MAHRVILAAALTLLVAVPCGATTPTPSATPQPTGDLGTKQVTGRVSDELDGLPILDATVAYYRSARFPPNDSGSVVTDDHGAFAFSLFLHDTDDVHITAAADGYFATDLFYAGYGLWIEPPLEIGLLPMRGSITIEPHTGVDLGCEGDGTVTITNSEPVNGEDVTIVSVSAANSYSQGDYGTGFTSDLSAIELPRTLAPGEQVAFPVHYSAAGQSYPSRLTVRVRSTAGEAQGFAVPYRGHIAGCGEPTPTPVVGACPGDCDGNGVVTIAELVRGVAMALGRPVAACANADLDASGTVEISEIVTCVVAATDGCPR